MIEIARNVIYLMPTYAPHVSLNLPRSLHKGDNAHSLLTEPRQSALGENCRLMNKLSDSTQHCAKTIDFVILHFSKNSTFSVFLI